LNVESRRSIDAGSFHAGLDGEGPAYDLEPLDRDRPRPRIGPAHDLALDPRTGGLRCRDCGISVLRPAISRKCRAPRKTAAVALDAFLDAAMDDLSRLAEWWTGREPAEPPVPSMAEWHAQFQEWARLQHPTGG
jgi:hypothetical protein